MTPGLRKFALTAHVVSSVSWLGSVASFLVLGIAGLTSRNPELVRACYLAMNLLGQFIIVPLSAVTLLTGLIESLGTQWGLFRYYWILVKFTLTVGATVLLLLHQFTAVSEAARRALGARAGSLPEVGQLGTQLVVDAALAVVVLLTATVLSIYKPWGRTPYGSRIYASERAAAIGDVAAGEASRPWVYPLLIGGLITVAAILHLTGIMGRH